MKIKELIKELKNYNENSIVTINCPNANDSRGIWYIEQTKTLNLLIILTL